MRAPLHAAVAVALSAVAALPALLGGCGGTVVGTPGPGADGGVPLELAACSGPGTCSLVASTCCGMPCGVPSLGAYAAVATGKEAAHHDLVCGPDPVACPAYDCPAMIPDGSLMAMCRGATPRCEAVDLRTEPVSACATDEDCVLHYNTCCQPCEPSPWTLVALGKTQVETFRKSACTGDEVCSRCMTPYPAETRAYCDPATKHCRVKNGPYGI